MVLRCHLDILRYISFIVRCYFNIVRYISLVIHSIKQMLRCITTILYMRFTGPLLVNQLRAATWFYLWLCLPPACGQVYGLIFLNHIER